jgi:hypothetical protein
MAALVDDTGWHIVRVEYLGAAAGCPDTLGRQDCYLAACVAVAWGLACLWVSGFLVRPGRHRCEANDRDQPTGRLSSR